MANERQKLENAIKIRTSFRDVFAEAKADALTLHDQILAENEYNFIDNELKFLYNCLYELKDT